MALLGGLRQAFFGKKSAIIIGTLDETTRYGIHKHFIPEWMIRTAFGKPRMEDLVYIRNLAKSPYVSMIIRTILSELKNIPWNVVVSENEKDKYQDANGEITPEKAEEIKHVKDFLNNPNTNKETFSDVFIDRWLRDVLEVNSGVLVKAFNIKNELVEVVAADGSTFTKNPDEHGMFTDRDDIVVAKNIRPFGSNQIDPMMFVGESSVRQKAAYFQFQWSTHIPVPFGKKEIVWLDWEQRTDKIYGYSPVQVLEKTLQMLIYSVDSELDYFNNNNTPRGIIGFEGADTEELKNMQGAFNNAGIEMDANGRYHRNVHKTLFINHLPKMERIEFTPAELQLIEKQKWYLKLVAGCFGVTPTEMGYTEEAKGLANQTVQSDISHNKSILSLIRMMEDKITHEVISEFGYDDLEFKFILEDTNKENAKFDLYQKQLNMKFYTVNEVRMKEGLEPVPWGEKPMGINEDGSAEVTDFQNGKGGNPDKGEDGKKKGGELKCAGAEEERESKKKMKSLAEDNPSALENDKEDSPKALAKAVDILMAENRKKILRMIDEEWDGKKDLSERARLMLKFAGIAELGALVIKNNFRNGWDAVEKKVNMNLIENQSAIDFLQDYTFDNIVGLTTDVSEKLVQQMKIAVLNQEPLDKIRERVMAVFNIGEDRAMAIAVTETNRAYNQGILIASKSAEAQGVKLVKKWRAHHDERTSDTCKALDGMTVDINDNFVSPDGSFNGQAPPAHVSCRSHLELFVKD